MTANTHSCKISLKSVDPFELHLICQEGQSGTSPGWVKKGKFDNMTYCNVDFFYKTTHTYLELLGLLYSSSYKNLYLQGAL